MPKWALFRISDPIITPMGSGRVAGFSKIARIDKPGQNWGFRDWCSRFGVTPGMYHSKVRFGDIWIDTNGRWCKAWDRNFWNLKNNVQKKNNQENLFPHFPQNFAPGFIVPQLFLSVPQVNHSHTNKVPKIKNQDRQGPRDTNHWTGPQKVWEVLTSFFFRYRIESLFDPTITPAAKRIHMMAIRMHPVTSQNLIIISR